MAEFVCSFPGDCVVWTVRGLRLMIRSTKDVGRAFRVAILTSLAMAAFAGNSLLCRAAIKETNIDPVSFTTIRILAGALALLAIAAARTRTLRVEGHWPGAFVFAAYGYAFSIAYATLTAATGALLLFGGAQATMIAYGFWIGERLRLAQVCGLAIAISGLAGLLMPGLTAPPLVAGVLMLLSGVAWGVYSLLGRGRADPVRANAGFFVRALPVGAVISFAARSSAELDGAGVMCAVASGALTSGGGYILWYAAIRELKAVTASTVQLSVPVLAALGGVGFLAEPITLRLLLASAATLGGIGLIIALGHRQKS